MDLARAAGVSASTVGRVERGQIGGLSHAVLRCVCAALEIQVDLVVRWRGAEADRLLARRHDLLAEDVTRQLVGLTWELRSEVSFSIYGERGVIDLLAWHAGTASLLVIELKTEIVDAGAMLATLDRKRRLAPEIARGLGWEANAASVALITVDTRTNRRRFGERSSMIRSVLPADGRALRGWLRTPRGSIAAAAFWRESFAGPDRVRTGPMQRVRRGRGVPTAAPASGLELSRRGGGG